MCKIRELTPLIIIRLHGASTYMQDVAKDVAKVNFRSFLEVQSHQNDNQSTLHRKCHPRSAAFVAHYIFKALHF